VKYKVKIMQGREVLLEGVLAPPKPQGRIVRPDTSEVGSLDEVAFTCERAINSQTDVPIRAHIEAVDE
jgi:hypothetical protein